MKKKILGNSLTILFIALFAWYGVTNKDSFTVLADVAVWSLLLVVVGKLLVFLSNGLFTTWTAELFTKKFSLREGIHVTVLSAAGNFFGPLLGGASIRAVYLKKYHSLSYSNFTATLMGYYLILFITNAMLAIVSLALLPKTHQTRYLIGLFAIWLVVLLALTMVRLPRKERFRAATGNRLGRFIVKVTYDIEDGWQLLIRNKTLLVKLTALAFLSLGATYFISFVEFQALHIAINVPALGLYTALVATSLLLSLTPGAIGIREAILILVGATIGISNQQVLQVAVIDRGVHFILLGVMFVLTHNSKFVKDMRTNRS